MRSLLGLTNLPRPIVPFRRAAENSRLAGTAVVLFFSQSSERQMEALQALREAAIAGQLPALDQGETITLGDRPFPRSVQRLCSLPAAALAASQQLGTGSLHELQGLQQRRPAIPSRPCLQEGCHRLEGQGCGQLLHPGHAAVRPAAPHGQAAHRVPQGHAPAQGGPGGVRPARGVPTQPACTCTRAAVLAS